MIFHVSIAADEPQRTARFIAELWGGKAYPFPPVAKGSWVATAGDDRNSTVEVYPRGTELHLAGEESQVLDRSAAPVRNGPFHAAIATDLSIDEVETLAEREGIVARVCQRAPFRVIEVWLDGCQMIEVLTPEMQREYLVNATAAKLEAMFGAGPPLQPA
jgi:hypothetical protein